MDFEITEYRKEAAPELIALWNNTLGNSFPMTERLWHQNVDTDPNYVPGDCLIVRSPQDSIVGMVLTRLFHHFVSNPDMVELGGLGWIIALIVAPQFQRNGLGTRLLALAEDRLRQDGAVRCRPGAGIGYFLPGLPTEYKYGLSFWERNGYQLLDEVCDLHQRLTAYISPPQPGQLDNGHYRVVPGQPGEEAAIATFLSRYFPGRWRYAVTETFARGGAVEDVLLLKDHLGVIHGFLSSWHYKSAMLGPSTYWYPAMGQHFGGIGPLGIAPEVRGLGWGRSLVAAGATTLQQRGVDECVIDCTTLVNFYGSLGFRIWRSYWRWKEKWLGQL